MALICGGARFIHAALTGANPGADIENRNQLARHMEKTKHHPRIAVLSNKLSTANIKHFSKVRDVIANTRNVIHFEIDDIAHIPDILRQFERTKPDLLVISGGDGTVQATLTSIINDKPFANAPAIAILPSGKTNMIAADLGLKGKPEKLFSRLVAIAAAGELPANVVRRFLLEMDLGNGDKPVYGMFFGGAAMVNGIKYCREVIYPWGLPNAVSHILAFALLLGASFGGGRKKTSALYSEPQKIIIRGGGELEGRYMTVVATTLNRLLLGSRPYGRDGAGNIGFSAVQHSPTAMGRALRGLISGKFGKKTIRGVNTRRSNEIQIIGTDPVTLDGEIFEVGESGCITLKGTQSLPFVLLR